MKFLKPTLGHNLRRNFDSRDVVGDGRRAVVVAVAAYAITEILSQIALIVVLDLYGIRFKWDQLFDARFAVGFILLNIPVVWLLWRDSRLAAIILSFFSILSLLYFGTMTFFGSLFLYFQAKCCSSPFTISLTVSNIVLILTTIVSAITVRACFRAVAALSGAARLKSMIAPQ